jgi:beta-glucuronidase
VFDQENIKVAESYTCQGSIKLKNPKLWWPHLMHPNPGYMYTMTGWLHSLSLGQDVYRIPFGIRKINWNATNILINGKDFYFRGFGRHEDSDIRGKGLDLPLVTR